MLFALVLICTVFSYQPAKAQPQNKSPYNIQRQPNWGPVGYDYVEYYYIPAIESYYSVPTHQFIYLDNNNWIFSPTLPPAYKNYNLYDGNVVVMNENKPYTKLLEHRVKYRGYTPKLPIIRDSKDEKYNGRKDNGKHKGWYKNKGKNDDRDDDDNKGNNGKHKGWDKDKKDKKDKKDDKDDKDDDDDDKGKKNKKHKHDEKD